MRRRKAKYLKHARRRRVGAGRNNDQGRGPDRAHLRHSHAKTLQSHRTELAHVKVKVQVKVVH